MKTEAWVEKKPVADNRFTVYARLRYIVGTLAQGSQPVVLMCIITCALYDDEYDGGGDDDLDVVLMI